MSVTKTFSAVGDGPDCLARIGDTLQYAISGTFVGTARVQRFERGGWTTVVAATAPVTATLPVESTEGADRVRYRVRCELYTSGSIVTSLSVTTEAGDVALLNATGSAGVKATRDGVQVVGVLSATAALLASPAISSPAGCVHAIEATFVETAGAGVYTAAIPVPAGATILDIIVNGVALWNPATSATLLVGDAADDDGYFDVVDLKATDLLAGESLSFAQAGGKAGAYIANSQVSPRYSATDRVIAGIVTTVGGSGTTGRTRLTVIYHLPVAADSIVATKV